MLKLLEFDYKIEYKKGKENAVADALSRQFQVDENEAKYVRNTTARAFSVVASGLGIPALLPFLMAVCQSKKSW
jgi:hypothetical protein